MLVMKFGGSSVGSIEALTKVVGILKDKEHSGKVRVVVLSAFSGMTDGLIDLAKRARAGDQTYNDLFHAMQRRHWDVAERFLENTNLINALSDIETRFAELRRILDGIAILQELSPRILDSVMSFGERLSASLLARILEGAGINAEYLDARKLIKTDDHHGNAHFLEEETFANISSYVNKKPDVLFIATGFIGSTMQDITTTLGRGGSDLSAAIFAAALNVKEVEIWTDVDGIMSADPRLVKNAFRIDHISYIEAMELSHFGAKVLYTPTVKPALKKGIPICIRNTFNPSCKGTRITEKAEGGEFPIRGISSINNVALIRIQGSAIMGTAGFSSRLFGAMARKGINIMMITQGSSEYSICLAILPENAETAKAAVKEELEREIRTGTIEEPVVERHLSIIAVVGSQMKHSAGVAGRVFHALGRNGINIIAIAQGSSELNISAVINHQDETKAVNAIHEVFFLAGVRSVNLFLVGTGLVGGTMLEQIAEHKEILEREHKVRINIVGAANVQNMVFCHEGLDPKDVKDILANPSESKLVDKVEPFNLTFFIEKMKKFNLPNSAFCDCTADSGVASQYAHILSSAIPIVTPNKRANSGSFEYYKKLLNYSKERGIPYLYEVTVCAGLPVISTLRDMYLSGDNVLRIEAVLSGTLSYIFNNYDGSKPFSALVREAKAKGFTEPDPRDDLNAMDAARKALILAREIGMPIEFSDVKIEPILPQACLEAPSVDAFFAELEKADGDFEKRRADAASVSKALRYVAVIEKGSVTLSLRSEAPGSPFRSLVDTDNMVVITSKRYSDLPMVIRGPGAGAQVTAGGVLADIVRIARTLV